MSIQNRPNTPEFEEGYDRIFRRICPTCSGSGETIDPDNHMKHSDDQHYDTKRCETCQGSGKTNNK